MLDRNLACRCVLILLASTYTTVYATFCRAFKLGVIILLPPGSLQCTMAHCSVEAVLSDAAMRYTAGSSADALTIACRSWSSDGVRFPGETSIEQEARGQRNAEG